MTHLVVLAIAVAGWAGVAAFVELCDRLTRTTPLEERASVAPARSRAAGAKGGSR